MPLILFSYVIGLAALTVLLRTRDMMGGDCPATNPALAAN